MENNENIDTNKIIIEELEKELDIAKKYIEENNRKAEHWNEIIDSLKNESEAKLRETREYYEKIINDLDNEKMELERKLQAIEGSRSYKMIRKIKGMLGDKNE